MEFNRNWAQFKIPTAVMTAASLAEEVLGRQGVRITDPAVFVGELQNMFQPPYATVLEEYGLPASTAVKLQRELGLARAATLDDVLRELRNLEVAALTVGPFEKEMLRDSQRGLQGPESARPAADTS